MKQWRVECEECDNESIVFSDVEAEFCPVCGRRTEAVLDDEDV
jgi:ribosomal protein S27E